MNGELTSEERRILEHYLPLFRDLVDGRRMPKTQAQLNFVEVAHGRAVPSSPHEIAFLKWKSQKIEIVCKQVLPPLTAESPDAQSIPPLLANPSDWASWVKTSNSMFAGAEKVDPKDDNWDPSAIH